MIHFIRHWPFLLASSLLLASCSTIPPQNLDPNTLAPPPDITGIPAPASLVKAGSLLELPPGFKARLDQEMAGISSKRRRADRLLALLFEKDALGIRYHFGTTMTAEEVLAAGMGNCISVSNLVLAAARHIGIDARFQEVLTDRSWSRIGETYFLNRHINVRMLGLNSRYDYEVDLRPTPLDVSEHTTLVSDRVARAHFYNNLAGEALAREEDALAFAYFITALNTAPQLSFIWSNLGTYYMIHRDFPAAQQALEHALALDWSNYTAINSIARLYHLIGRDEDAARYDARAERIRRDNPYYLATLAERYLEQQNVDTARKLVEQALAKEQEDYVLHLLAARIYLALGDDGKADAHLNLIEQAEQQDISAEDAELISRLKQQVALLKLAEL